MSYRLRAGHRQLAYFLCGCWRDGNDYTVRAPEPRPAELVQVESVRWCCDSCRETCGHDVCGPVKRLPSRDYSELPG